MEKVDKNTKLLFNIGYLLSQEPDTNDVLKKMIDKAHTDIEKHALKAGKQQFTKDAIEGQDITPKRERTESEVLHEYYQGMEEAYKRGDFEGTIPAEFKDEIRQVSERQAPAEPETPAARPDPEGKPSGWQKMMDEMTKAAEDRQKNKDKDRGRD